MFSGGENWCRAGELQAAGPVYSCWESGLHQQLSLEKQQETVNWTVAISPGSIPSPKVLPHLFAVGILPLWMSQLGLQSQLVRAQLASFKRAGCSLSSLDKVSRGEKHFGLLCTWLFVWEAKEDMRRETLSPKMEKVAKHLVGFGCEEEESSQTAECSWFRISCWIRFRKLFQS